MDTSIAIVRSYFAKLGVPSEVVDIYLALKQHGPQTISQLARSAGVERTRIYRLLDALESSGLIEVQVENKRSIFRAAPTSNLHILLSKKEQELKDLQGELEEITRLAESLEQTSPFSRVQFYRGRDGAKQMLWNQTKATTERVCVLNENLQIRTDSAFFERWVRRNNERGLRGRGVVNEQFIQTQQKWYASHHNERLAHWQSRFLPSEVFAMTHSTVVYDDVTSFYSWRDGEVFGIEIHNPDIATTHRQLFDMLWTGAKPVKIKVNDQEMIP
jgi:sugar-specific transcriptional regulator TrmB